MNNLGRLGLVVSSRHSSSRLPGKAMLPLGGHSTLGFLLTRLNSSKLVDDFIVATSVEKDDDAIEKEAKKYDFSVSRGSLNNVISRYAQTIEEFNLDTVIRVTADSPFIDGTLIDTLINQIGNQIETIHSTRPRFCKGLNIEIMPANMILFLNQKNDISDDDKEHLTSWFYSNNSPWKPIQFDLPFKESVDGISLALDTEEDYKTVKSYLNLFDNIQFKPEDLLKKLNYYFSKN